MSLLIDVGNTRSHWAIVADDRVVQRLDLPHGDDAWRAWVQTHAPRPTAIVDVNPPVRDHLAAELRALGLEVRVLGLDLPAPIELAVSAPAQVGHDRVLNGLWAARNLPGQPVLVADLGTAITIDVVDAHGRFRGGAIAPGLRLQARALHHHTAQLPEVDLRDATPPDLGGTTVACITSGILWGVVGLLRVQCERVARALGRDPTLVLTGGDAPHVATLLDPTPRLEPDLTLLGLHEALKAAP